MFRYVVTTPIALLVASPAFGQTMPRSAPDGAPAEKSEAAKQVDEAGEKLVEAGAKTNEGVKSMMECAEVASEVMKLEEEATAYKKLAGSFDLIGKALTVQKVSTQVMKGDNVGAAETGTKAAMDELACEVGGDVANKYFPIVGKPATCGAWGAGRLIGEAINQLHIPFDPQERTVEEFVNEKEFEAYEALMSYLRKPATEEYVRAMLAQFRTNEQALANLQSIIAAKKARCTEESRKSAVDDLLKKAQASASEQIRTNIPQTDLSGQAREAGESAAAAAQGASSALMQGQMEAAQGVLQRNATATGWNGNLSAGASTSYSSGQGTVMCDATNDIGTQFKVELPAGSSCELTKTGQGVWHVVPH